MTRRRIAIAVALAACLMLVALVRYSSNAALQHASGSSDRERTWFGVGTTPGLPRAPARAALSGSVRGDQAPIAGALVCAACVACEGTSAAASPCTTTDAAGTYAFEQLMAGAYFVSATANGWLPGSAAAGQPVVLEGSQPRTGVDIALAPGGARLLGSVVDATGGAISHARVRAIRMIEPRVSLDIETDDDGRFALSLQPGFILLVAEAEGYAPARAEAIAPRADVRLMLTPAASAAGVVVSALDESPVAGVEVRALALRNRASPVFRSAVSDHAGRFQIGGLQPDSYQLVAKGGRWRGESLDVVELGLAEQRSDLRVRVQPAAEVVGRVVDASDGTPCRQGFVSLGAPDPFDATQDQAGISVGPAQIADIQADGVVRFGGVPAGNYFVAVRCHERLLRDGPRFLQVADQTIEGLSWKVAPTATLRVKVVDGARRPLADTRFMLTWPRIAADRPRGVTTFATDAAGEYALRPVPVGRYGVGPYDGVVRAPEVEVEVREAAAEVEATLVIKGGTILVEAKTRAGAAVNALHVTAREIMPAPVALEAQAQTPTVPALALGDGRFRIGPVAPGRYVVSADDGINPGQRSDDTPGRELQVRDGAETRTTILLERGGTIRGRVLDASGNAAPNVWVSAEHAQVATSATSPFLLTLSGANNRVLTDTEGRFALEGVAEDARYMLRAEDSFGAAALLRDVAVSTDVVLRLPVPGSIAGVAVDSAGQPIARFSLQAKNADTRTGMQQRVVVDDRGRFSVPELAPGPIELTLSTIDGEVGTAEIELRPGQRITDLQVVLEQPQQLAASDDESPLLAPDSPPTQ